MSSITFVPYEPHHLAEIKLRPEQVPYFDALVKPEHAESLANGLAWTALDGDRVLGCAGLSSQWPGRKVAWTISGNLPSYAGPPILAKLKEIIAAQIGRIEFSVPCNNGEGCLVAHELGFKVEGMAEAYGPDGADHFMYAKVV